MNLNESPNNDKETNEDEETNIVDRRQQLISILGRALEVSVPSTMERASSERASSGSSTLHLGQQSSADTQHRLNDAAHRLPLAAAARQAARTEQRLAWLGHQESSTCAEIGNVQEDDDDSNDDANDNGSNGDETNSNKEED